MRLHVARLALIASSLAWLGCVDFQALEQEKARRDAPPPQVFQTVSLKPDELPDTERVSLGLDQDHLIASIPDGWVVPALRSKALIRMQFDRAERYPAILIFGGENRDTVGEKEEPIRRLGKSNLEAYAQTVEKRLGEELKKLHGAEAAPPIVSGLHVDRFYGVMYDQPAVVGKKKLDRLVITTIQRGRQYTVELRAHRGTLARFRPYAYAVAARLKIF